MSECSKCNLSHGAIIIDGKKISCEASDSCVEALHNYISALKEKEYNYSDGITWEVKRFVNKNGYHLTQNQIENISYEICNDDEINTLLNDRIEEAIFAEDIAQIKGGR